MELGPHTLSVFVSLIIVLAAAAVALVCDLLKGNNDHLREVAVELKIRNEEAERRMQASEKRQARRTDVPAMAPAPAVAENVPLPETVEVPKPAEAVAERRQGPRREQRPKRQMSPSVAAVAEVAAGLVNRPDERPSAETSIGSIGRKNWDSILKNTRRGQGSVIPFESIRDAVPAGFHDASVLQRAVETGRTVTALVLAIGTNALKTQEGADEVVEFLKSLAGPQDFACQSGADEYVLICMGEQGASAQRRLSATAERLWDFQLSALGGLGVQFSWGSAEARGERIGEAVATAIEQMHETRQSRRANIAKAV